MIILDTNVLSELLRGSPSASVASWLDSKPSTALFTTAVTQAEMFAGARIMPAGKRRSRLEADLSEMFDKEFVDRILPFGTSAAPLYGEIIAKRRELGRPISQFDAQIAAIARWHGADLVTRNVADFQDCAIRIVDPWDVP